MSDLFELPDEAIKRQPEIHDPEDDESRARYKEFTLPDGRKVDVLMSVVGSDRWDRLFSSVRKLKAGLFARWHDGHQKARLEQMKSKSVETQALYANGRRFRVLGGACQLQDALDHSNKDALWLLKPGNVLTCFGPSEPWGQDRFGVPIHRVITFGGAKGQQLGKAVVFAPSIGAFAFPYPDPQYLSVMEAA